jgi:hypothetical protein
VLPEKTVDGKSRFIRFMNWQRYFFALTKELYAGQYPLSFEQETQILDLPIHSLLSVFAYPVSVSGKRTF